MAINLDRKDAVRQPEPFHWPGAAELAGIFILAGMVAWFLHVSWRKWPDPIVDIGAQWYDTWRMSLGAVPGRDFDWNYGPLSLAFNALLFKLFGPGMMVLVTANLLIYAAILTLGYMAFRIAWGRLAAFAAIAVFISVFSFSHLRAVGNYNYATPYSNEATHGMLLMLVTVFVAMRWCRKPSFALSFLLGLCGGIAAVLKPEFMLAGGAAGIAAVLLRRRQRQPIRLVEWALILVGIALPTLIFAAWFAQKESWKAALIESCQAWWLVLVNQREPGLVYQARFSGLDQPWLNGSQELGAAALAVAIIGAIWTTGWFANRLSAKPRVVLAVLAAIAFGSFAWLSHGWLEAGRCLPGLVLIIFVIMVVRLRGELLQTGRGSAQNIMALLLVLIAGAMMARMPLRARVYHFGFFQAAFAGMVAAAAMVAETPRWIGAGLWGRRLATFGSMGVLAVVCASIARTSYQIRADQTQSVASGRDHFYASTQEVDETGLLVDWCVDRLRTIPTNATLQVLPEGEMINYLSRHVQPLPDLFADEDAYVKLMKAAPPDYVILITRDLHEFGISGFGTPGNPGEKIIAWLRENYVADASHPGRAKAAALLRRMPPPQR